MTILQTINLGNYANDGTGDDLRTAFTKVNENLTAIQTTADNNIFDGINLGSIILRACDGTTSSTIITTTDTTGLIPGMHVKVSAGNGSFQDLTTIVSITNLTTFVVSTVPLIALSSVTITASPVSCIFTSKHSNMLQFKTITSLDESIIITNTDNTLDVKTETQLIRDPEPTLSANLNLNNYSMYGGDIQATVYGIDYRITTAILEIMLYTNQTMLDFGSFLIPTNIDTIDMGTFILYPSNVLDFGVF